MIGLSPLPTTHPLHFQLKWVRASTTSYCCFTLAMGRSLCFGSSTRHCNALFRLAFAPAPPHGLTSRRILTRRLILQKARHHQPPKGPALTACRHMDSGTLSLPSRGTFHPSLTVLDSLSVNKDIQAYQTVLTDSHQIPRARYYSGHTHPHAP